MRKALVIAVLAVVIAGCVSGSQNTQSTSFNDGIVIKSFRPDSTIVDAGSYLTLYFEIENVGDKTARNVVAKLMAPDDFVGDKVVNLDDIEPPSKRSGTKSPPVLYWFRLQAPSDLTENAEKPAKFTLRVFYDYASSAHTRPIVIYSKDEFRRLQSQGSAPTEVDVAVENNNGPIQFSVSYPVIPYFDPENDRTSFQIVVDVMNVGQGTPIYNGEDNVLVGSVSTSTGSIQCSYNQDFTEPGRSADLRIKLSRERKAKFVCEVMLDPSEVQDENIFTINFDFNYTYYVTASTEVTVVGPEY